MTLESMVILSSLHSQSARRCLEDSLGKPQHIAPLPRIIAELAQLTTLQAFDACQVSRLIQTDPALIGEVMRIANSPALRPRLPLRSPQQAVSWLGIAEVRNIAIAVTLRGEVFVAPGHEPESEELWREAWLAGLWAKEIARERRSSVESAFLAALMHRSGAALSLKILSQFEAEQRTVMDARTFAELVVEFEPAFGRQLMGQWRIPGDVQDGASDWRQYRTSPHSDLAGMVHAAHLLATHTMYPQLLGEELVLESAVFDSLGVVPDDRLAMLAMREHVRSVAGL